MKYSVNEEYRKIGQSVIEQVEELKHLATADCRIEFLASDNKKTSNGKDVLGECVKVQDLYKEFCPYDFLIIFYDPNIQDLTEDQLKILAEHELLHIGYEYKENGEPRYFVRPHDYDDFKQITDKYGTDWAKKP
jgi:predicted adenine nucleotide alpha hydrolase (AANH) superfamily ATPase